MKETFETEKPRIKRIDRISGSILGGLCPVECNHLIDIAPELTKDDKEYLRTKLFIGFDKSRTGIPYDWGARTGFELPKLNDFDHDLDVAPAYSRVM